MSGFKDFFTNQAPRKESVHVRAADRESNAWEFGDEVAGRVYHYTIWLATPPCREGLFKVRPSFPRRRESSAPATNASGLSRKRE